MTEIYNIGTEAFNSYLICGEKNIIIDTVPHRLKKEFFLNINKYLNISEIDFVIFTRTTPDAAGCIEELIVQNPSIGIYATTAGLKNLKEIMNLSFSENVIKNEGKLLDLRFIITPNLSWPDTCAVYLEKEKVLFSGNLFCNSPEYEAFGREFLENAVITLKGLNPKKIMAGYCEAKDIDMYDELFKQSAENKIAVIYASTSGATKTLAYTAAEELKKNGVEFELFDCDKEPKIADIEKCTAFLIGTPTINHTARKSLLNILTSLNVIKNTGKKAFLFGSYGWSGEGVNIVSSLLANLKIKPAKKAYRCIFKPSEADLIRFRDSIKEFLEEI